MRLTNLAAGRLLPTVLDLPVGRSSTATGCRAWHPGETHEESFTIRTERRGVIPVGPATTRRGDPLGLFSRDLCWTEVTEVLVRPPMVPLDSLGAGLLRDLEGVSTDAVSQSDLAFHTLREYVPGDELRHVHWRSSAKAMAAAGTDPAAGAPVPRHQAQPRHRRRRRHRAPSWIDPEDFETAMSVAASLAVRAVLDEFDTSFVCGDQASSGRSGHLALDAICRAGFGRTGLRRHRAPGGRRWPPTPACSSWSAAPRATLRGADPGGLGVRTRDPADRPSWSTPPRSAAATEADGVPILHLARREDLAGLLRWSVR